ncbi:MAG: EAL domain-containing protein [Campylobacterota bacterium]|nr:EAL domain-containing protein [Campylobacterota bacterium]
MLKKEDCSGIKLLYVEDDKDARGATIKVLEGFFSDITVAIDGQDGLEKIQESKYDLILTDINMPNLNGVDMLKEIKKVQNNIYTIVISANSDHQSFTDTIKLGVKGYILKPINMYQFIDSLESAVQTINAQKQINILLQYKELVDQTSIVSKSDINGNITFVNDKFCEISGYTLDELIGMPHNTVRDPDVPKSVFKELWETIKSKKVWNGQIKNRRKDGGSYYVDATICPILGENGEIIEYIGLRNDITEIINPKKQLTDEIKIMEQPLLVMIKIENFSNLEHLYDEKVINDMLELFKNKIDSYLPDACSFDKIYNLGDGEFALLKNMVDGNTSATQKEIQLKQFQQNIKKNILTADDYEFDLSVLLSFSTKKDKIYENVKYGLLEVSKKQEDIIFANDLTKYAKENAIKSTKTIDMIKKAIENKKIISHFQPITNNDNMKVEKYESLVRLENEEGRVLSPWFFLEVAKESGYYNKITNIVIDNYFEALAKTQKEVSLNLSAIDIEDLEIRNRLINLVMANMHMTHRMVFELLEDEEVKDFDIVKDFIALIKTFGVKIAIDDFGAGVSNFERLLDYQPDILKIDACLIKNIDKDKYSRDVVETIQLFAWKQKIKTVAEFVETPEILQIVKDIGINYTQGYLLGKPEPLDVHEN